MNEKLRALILSALLLTFCSFGAQATGWYVGGGAATSNLEEDLDEDIDQGFGFAVSAGYGVNNLFGIEALLSSTVHEEDITDDWVLANTLMLGAKLSFGDGSFRPYVVGGISANEVDFDNFDEITGDGSYWGIGADIFINQNHAINVSYRLNDWEGDDSVFDYDVRNKMLTVVYNYHFSGNQ